MGTGKYVTEFMGDRVKRYMQESNESAKQIVNGNKHEFGKLYREWTLKTKREIAVNGSQEVDAKSNANNARSLGLRKFRHMKGSEEHYQSKRAQKRLKSIRQSSAAKVERKKEKVKKFKREKFRKWWQKNRDRVKLRKGKRRM